MRCSANPSRLDLGQLKFVEVRGAAAAADLSLADVVNISQRLDTWHGVLHSSWNHPPSGTRVVAETVVDMASSTGAAATRGGKRGRAEERNKRGYAGRWEERRVATVVGC